jgi:hypothetical protein
MLHTIIYLVFEPIHWVYDAFSFNCEVSILKTEDEIVRKRRTWMENTYKGKKNTEVSTNMHDLENLAYRHNISQYINESSNISALFLPFKE